MRHFLTKGLAISTSLITLAACSGAGTSSDTSTRTLTGSVPAVTSGNLSHSLTGNQAVSSTECRADTIIATDTTGVATSAAVAEDCTFSLTLETGKSYAVSLVLNDTFVASLIFDSGIDGFSSSGLPITVGDEDVELGTITITGSTAIPQHNPLDKMDEDGDGISDLDDTDDDGDGIADEDEGDCDLDGFRDDHDRDNDCDEGEGHGQSKILEIKPRNDPQPGHGNDRVDLDKEVRARASCSIDQESVTNETFAIESEDGEMIECEFTFSQHGGGTRIECTHEADFEADTVYTLTLDGLTCENGDPLPVKVIHWRTEVSDDDDGDAEDSFDDSDSDDSSDNNSGDDSGDDSEDDAEVDSNVPA